MQVPGSDNTGPGSDIWWPELMSEGKETLLEQKKVNGTVLGSNFILSIIFVSEWALSLRVCRSAYELSGALIITHEYFSMVA